MENTEFPKNHPETTSLPLRLTKSVLYRLKRLPGVLFGFVAGRIPVSLMKCLIRICITSRVDRLSPEKGLLFLFGLDDHIHRLQNLKAIDYDKGIHTKHRHTGYHDFFVDRINPEETVLDVGCGKGEVAFDVAEKSGATVFGIDSSEVHIEWARKNKSHERVEFLLGKVPDDVPGKKFDVVLMSNILEHLPSRVEFLQRLSAAVKPERFLFRVPLFERDWRVPLRKELGVEWRLDKTHEIEYTLESFAEEMTAAGLEIIHQEVRWGEIWAEAVPGTPAS